MNFKVYYQKEKTIAKSLRTFSIDHITLKNLNKTHTFLKEVEAEDFEDLYRKMQGEVWSPNGEARSLIKEKELVHTSLSMGDVAENENNEFFVCNDRGWKPIELAKINAQRARITKGAKK